MSNEFTPWRRTFAGCIAATLWLANCGCGSNPIPPTANAPRSLAQQADEVRAGRSDQIEVADELISDADLAVVSGLRDLRLLLLDNSSITDAGVERLVPLESLEHLRIRGGTIGDNGFRHLGRIHSLRVLNLPQARCTDDGLASLRSLPKLEQLRLGSPLVTDLGVAQLRDFAALRRIHFIGVPLTDGAIDAVAGIPRLESFYVDDSQLTDAGFERLFQARPDLHVHVNQQHHDRDPHAHQH